MVTFCPSIEVLEDRTVPSTWFDSNLQDPELIAYANTHSTLDRTSTIGLLRSAEDGNVVSQVEYNDLIAIGNYAASLGMPEYVSVLYDKVTEHNVANQWYQGTALGDLGSGSTGTQLEKLISKWFFGTDHPLAIDKYGRKYSYTYSTGTLFINGVTYTDVKQGYVNDCYFLSALAEIASRSPGVILDSFIDNGDNTWTVRFYHGTEADYVTVDRYLPVYGSGYLVFAGYRQYAKSVNTELWVSLFEKAYAQLAEEGWSRPTTKNSYGALNYGYIGTALSHVSGREASIGNAMNQQSVIDAWNSGKYVGFASKSYTSYPVVRNHAYVLVGYNASTGVFKLYQPLAGYNPTILNLTWTQMVSYFSYWDMA